MLSGPLNRRQPGDRLVQMIWQMALARGGKPPLPTIERVNTLKILAESWKAEDERGESDEA